MSQYEEMFEKKSVWNAILSMAVPSVITVLVMILYNMADMFFIGQLGDTRQVAAISIVGPLFSISAALATMIGSGGSAMIAKALGEAKEESARTYASLCFYGAVVLGVIVATLILVFSKPLLSFLGATTETHAFASTYMVICACGVPFMLLTTTMATIVRAEGAIKEGVVGNLIATITNIILDPIFILVLHMGVGGAALATVIGNAVGCTYYVIFVQKKAQVLNFQRKLVLKKPLLLFSIMALGMPNACSSMLSGFASTFSNRLLVTYGTNAIAAMAAAGKVTLLIVLVQMGICMGIQPYLAYNYGARNIERIKEIIQKVILLTGIVGLICGSVCYLGRHVMIGMFLKEATALHMGERMVIYLVVASPLIGIYYLSTNFLQAAGNAFLATIVSILRQGVLLITCLYVLHQLFGLTGVAMAYMVADVLAVFIAFIFLMIQFRKIRNAISK